MKLLVNLFGSLVVSVAIMILASAEALIDFLILRVNWSLIFVLAFAALIIFTLLKKAKTYKGNGKSI